ncbi:hypothetical protein Chor_013725 [Crotalus horridus]
MSAPDSLPEGFTEFEMISFGTMMLAEANMINRHKTILFRVLALFGFSLNVLTIVAFWKVKEIQTPGNFLIFNLALSDCGICINAFIAAFSSFLRYWPYGSDGCQIHGFQGFLTALTSINCAAAIAWDRYHQYCSRDRNYITFLIPLVLFNFVIPIFIILMSYQSIDSKFRKTAQLKFNTGLPVKSLVFCWGPYSLLSMYAAVENVALVSPKILMVSKKTYEVPSHGRFS